MRRTKIVATLGPATDRPNEMDAMVEAGLDVARINFSHGKFDDHAQRIDSVRECAARHKRSVAIMADLQGPKIRIGRFTDGSIVLERDAEFTIDSSIADGAGDINGVGSTYTDLYKDVEVDDILMLDDGNIILRVIGISGTAVQTLVRVGGELSNNKGLNKRGGGLTASALTEKDHKDIQLAASLDVDYVAVSFVRNAIDIHVARGLLDSVGSKAGIVSKIERSEAIEHLNEIISASDVVMIARGDLGIEIGYAALPAVQKRIIDQTRRSNAISITATQMMQSMIEHSQPTRAEVLDVANAVLDGTDCVMLSAESAVGKHPSLVIDALDRICSGAEQHPEVMVSSHRLDSEFSNPEEATAMAAMYTANHYDVTAIVALTESGSTAKLMSRINSDLPIYAISQHVETHRRVAMYRGVYPIDFNTSEIRDITRVERGVIAELVDRGAVRAGDRIILTKGDVTGVAGSTNTMKVLAV